MDTRSNDANQLMTRVEALLADSVNIDKVDLAINELEIKFPIYICIYSKIFNKVFLSLERVQCISAMFNTLSPFVT